MIPALITAIISSITSCITVALPIAWQYRVERKMQTQAIQEGLKCSLRNDILQMYLQFKSKREISMYVKQAINYSFEIYKKYGGNSFVEEIVNEMNTWKII